MKKHYWKQKPSIARLCKSKNVAAQTLTFRNRYAKSNQRPYVNKSSMKLWIALCE